MTVLVSTIHSIPQTATSQPLYSQSRLAGNYVKAEETQEGTKDKVQFNKNRI